MNIPIWFLVVPFWWKLVISQGISSRDNNIKPYRVVCYWGTWAFYRNETQPFKAEDIAPNLCTHLNYAFAKLSDQNEIALADPTLDDEIHGMIHRMTALKEKDPHLTTLISIGGWNDGSDKYSAMASQADSRKKFIQSVVQFLKDYDLDGLDIAWLYPTMKAEDGKERHVGRMQDRQNFVALLKELRKVFAKSGYILSAAVSAIEMIMTKAYDIEEMNKYLDYINLMTFDYHGGWEHRLAHPAPLYGSRGLSSWQRKFTVDYSVQYWLKNHFDGANLILGIPFFGRTFELLNKRRNHIGSPAKGNGQAGPETREPGMLAYNEFCLPLSKRTLHSYWDNEQLVPYAVSDDQWLGYDDFASIKEKVKYLLKNGLGGVMVWSIDLDDYNQRCSDKTFPLLRAVVKDLDQGTGFRLSKLAATAKKSKSNWAHFLEDLNSNKS